jgi:hypothetical protein
MSAVESAAAKAPTPLLAGLRSIAGEQDGWVATITVHVASVTT